jgi:HSP20 family protein
MEELDMLPERYRRHRGLSSWEWPEESILSPFFRALSPEGWTESLRSAAYPVDIHETEDKVFVEAEMPGFKRDEINVDIHKGRLHIEAERAESEKHGTPHMRERRYNRIERSFSLPSEVDPDKASANLREGVLHVEMPKIERSGSSKIEIT